MENNQNMATIHDRTLRLVNKLIGEHDSAVGFNNIAVNVIINKLAAGSFNGQVMAMTSVNLIARFCDKIYVNCPEGISRKIMLPFGNGDTLDTSLVNIAKAVNPAVIVELANYPSADNCITLTIGKGYDGLKETIIIDSDGWLASINQELSNHDKEDNPLGAMMAACFGAAEVFRNFIHRFGTNNRLFNRDKPSFIFSGLTYNINQEGKNSFLPKDVNIGQIMLVGAGAVGNGLMYALSLIPDLSGVIDVIDYDKLDWTNLNRHLLATADDVGDSKAIILKNRMKHSPSLTINAYNQKYLALDSSKRSTIDVAVSTVDNNDARRELQSDLPRVLLHGATDDLSLVVSHHNFLDGACLGCLFPKQLKAFEEIVASETGLQVEEVTNLLRTGAEFTFEHFNIFKGHIGSSADLLINDVGKPFKEVYAKKICGQFKVSAAGQEYAATVSFVSALTGILLATELLKETIPALSEYRINNYMRLNTLAVAHRILTYRQKDENCICNCDNRHLVERYNEKHGVAQSCS